MNELIESQERRAKMADRLIEQEGQQVWYSQRASAFRWRGNALSIGVMIAPALVAGLPALKDTPMTLVDQVVAVLSIFVVIGQGLISYFKYIDRAQAYRRASEHMKSEKRIFVGSIGKYDCDDEEAFRRYVTELESIISAEVDETLDGSDGRSGTE